MKPYPPVASRSSKWMRPQRWASEATVTTRAGALASRSGSSRLVSRNGPRWLTASIMSWPSLVRAGLRSVMPALFTRRSSRSSRASTSAAAARTDACSPRSQSTISVTAPGTVASMSAFAAVARPSLRHSRRTRNPERASPRAVSSPMPEFAPVTSAVLVGVAMRGIVRAARVSRATGSADAGIAGDIHVHALAAGRRGSGVGAAGERRVDRDVDGVAPRRAPACRSGRPRPWAPARRSGRCGRGPAPCRARGPGHRADLGARPGRSASR